MSAKNDETGMGAPEVTDYSPGSTRRKMLIQVDEDETGMGAPKVTRSPSLLKTRSALGLDVAVVGGKESLSHQALMSIMDGDERLNVTHTDSFEAVFKLVDRDVVHSGVVPVENTSMGPFPGTFHLLLLFPEIKIIGEHIVEENHCLCALPGTKLEDVDEIAAHPWAGAQCKAWLSRFHKKAAHPIRRTLATDTAAACKMALDRPNTAVVQQRGAAEALGLEVLAEGISDDVNNKTRFILVSKEELAFPQFENMTTTVAFALHNKTNAIFKALACFGLRDIDIRRMLTRPTSTAWGLVPEDARMQWEYYIILDIQGCPQHHKKVAAALAALEEFCAATRVLGSYRIAQDRQTVARQRLDSIREAMRGGLF